MVKTPHGNCYGFLFMLPKSSKRASLRVKLFSSVMLPSHGGAKSTFILWLTVF